MRVFRRALLCAALSLAAAARGAVTMDPVNGVWRDDFRDLSGLELNQQGKIVHPSGFIVSADIVVWAQPYGGGMTQSFSDPGAQLGPTVRIDNLGNLAEELTLWYARYDPSGNMKFVEEFWSPTGSDVGDPNNGLVFKDTIQKVPYEGLSWITGVGWGTFEVSSWGKQIECAFPICDGPIVDLHDPINNIPQCLNFCQVAVCQRHDNAQPYLGVPKTPAIGSWFRKPIYFGPGSSHFVPGQGYSATFLAAADLGESHFVHSTVPYLEFGVREQQSGKHFGSTTLYEADFIAKETLANAKLQATAADAVNFVGLTPVTVSLDPVPELPGAKWDFVASSMAEWENSGQLLDYHAHCTLLGPVYATANRGGYSSPVLDTLSDNTRWESISWVINQTTGYVDSKGECTELLPRVQAPYNDSAASVIPCGSPLTPVRLTYRIRRSGEAWAGRTIPHGGEEIPGLIGMNMVYLSSTVIRDGSWQPVSGRYFAYDLALYNRTAARELDPDLAPANKMNEHSGEPFPDYIYFAGLRPIVKQIRVSYRPCAARAVSRLIAPASVKKWKTVFFEVERPTAATRVGVDVLSADGRLLVSDVKPGQSLEGLIDPFLNPSLKLSASLFSDPADCGKRPVLLSWGVTWEPIVDLMELGCNGIRPRLGESCPIQVEVSEPGHVRIGVYDMAGQLIFTVLDGEVPAQALIMEWDGRNERGEIVAPGVYFISAKGAGGKRKVRRLAVIR